MSGFDTAARLLADFGESIGIPQLGFDDKGCCCLVFDNQILANIAFEERLARLVLFSYLGQVRRSGARTYAGMLEGNFFWQGTGGATLSIEGGSGSAVLIQALPLATLDAETFHKTMEDFVNTAEHWIGRLRLLAEGDEDYADRPGPSRATQGMRV